MSTIYLKKIVAIIFFILFIGAIIAPTITGNDNSNVDVNNCKTNTDIDLTFSQYSIKKSFSRNNNKYDIYEDNEPMIFNGGDNRGWSVTEVVSKDIMSPCSHASLMVDNSGTVHVAWYRELVEDFWIFYNYKTAGGSWNSPEIVHSGTESRSSPSLYVEDDGTVHVAWEDTSGYAGSGNDYDVLYKYKTAGGSWSSTEVVSTESTSDSNYPSLAVDNIGTLHVTWQDKTDYTGSGNDDDIFYKYRTDGGSWSITEVASTESTDTSWYPSLAVDNIGTLHVTWQDKTDYTSSGDNTDIFYKYRTDGGSWSITEVVSSESINSSFLSSVDVEDDGTVHVAWVDNTDYAGSGDDTDIFYKYRTAGGSWSSTEVVSTESTDVSRNPSLAVDNIGTLHVTWQDKTDYAGSGDDADIFYNYKTAGGSWSSAEVVSTESTESSYRPSVDVEDDGTVHVAWEDDTWYGGSGNTRDIFYKYRGSENQPPNKPTIDGPSIGILGIEYEYIFNALDPDWDDVKFIIDWGDDNSEITDFYPTCTDVKVSHIWVDKGIYGITVQAEDINGLISPQASLRVIMPINRASINFHRMSFFEQFPILRQIFGSQS